MKAFSRATLVKVISFLLCISCLATTIICTLAAVILIDAGFYTSTEAFLTDGYLHDMLTADSTNIVYHSITSDTGYFPLSSELSPQNTNIRFALLDSEENVIAQNTDSLEDCRYFYYFTVDTEDDIPDIWMISDQQAEEEENVYILKAYISESLSIPDKYALAGNLINIGYTLRYTIYIIAICCLMVALVCFIHLMCVAARRPHSDDCHPGPLNTVPFDLLVTISAVAFILILEMVTNAFYTGEVALVILFAVWCTLASMAILGLCMSAASRIKQKNLLKNLLISLIFRAIGKGSKSLIKSIPLVPRSIVCLLGITAINFLIYYLAKHSSPLSAPLFIIVSLAFILLGIYVAVCIRSLIKGSAELSKGDLSYKVDTSTMIGALKRHGNDLNSISEGMSRAVDERLKSDRTKTELITNVSHDIKNPLTSIINYAQLIGDDKATEEKRKEYSEVLLRKSAHLKRLLEDLVEISKATTGNLEIKLIKCDAGVLLTQISGEFEARCKNAGLELITIQPDDPMPINVDGKKIWRVFENLMGNVCKYSLSGSRVYLTLDQIEDHAVFTFRNTSKEALNISPDELRERFVRGDTSRSTEGNGLGLSIADSLTELMGGKLSISIDGDLFKVTLEFPITE